MTELVLKVGRQAREWTGISWPTNGTRLVLIFALTAIAAISPELRQIVITAISDAYLQVAVFVAATLALVYTFERSGWVPIAWPSSPISSPTPTPKHV